jgi:uncharacterized membrane protein YkoI
MPVCFQLRNIFVFLPCICSFFDFGIVLVTTEENKLKNLTQLIKPYLIMKKLVLIICVAIISSGTTFAQKKSAKKTTKVIAQKEVVAPVEVKDAFQQNFSGSDAKWSKNYSGHWIANFTKEDVKTAVEYQADGKWVATRSAYAGDKLPETVAATLKTKYPAASIKDGWKIERADVAAYYKVNIQENGTEKGVLINDAGTVTEQ